MKFQLYRPQTNNESVEQRILLNRGLQKYGKEPQSFFKDIENIRFTWKDFKIDNVFSDAAAILKNTIDANKKAVVVIDSDCDGYTSSAILINYLHDVAPTWVDSNLTWIFHSGKQHGLNDCINKILVGEYELVIIPDAGSNDYIEHKALKDKKIPVIILDHHEAPKVSTDAYVINNQLSDYPNKFLSGAGVVWQFIRCFDEKYGYTYADKYIDLVALGLCGDMMSMQSPETAGLILEGFKENNITNPFVRGMREKNAYSLGSVVTPMGAAFYIVPFVNAIVRSGTAEEKELVFSSILSFKAYNEIPSTKRGHKAGEMETVLTQALRVVTNVKSRQTKKEAEGMAFLEKKIVEEDLLKHQVLVFLLQPGQIDKNIAGLVANKIMGKYQRPVCVLTLTNRETNSYEGSCRGCEVVGVTEFKDICHSTGEILYAEGHQGAFGLGILKENLKLFIDKTDEILKDMPNEPVHYVDYLWKNTVDENIVEEIASKFTAIWGTGFPESHIGIERLEVPVENMALLKRGTLRIDLPNISLVKFNLSDVAYNEMTNGQKTVTLNIVGRPDLNTWNGVTKPQLIITDFENVSPEPILFYGFDF